MIDGGILTGPMMAGLAQGVGAALSGGPSSATAEGAQHSALDGSNWTVNFKSPGATGASPASPLGSMSPTNTLVWAGVAVLVAVLVFRSRTRK